MTVRSIIKSQIIGALENATFPINSPQELIAALPDGENTKCRAGELEMTAGEAGKMLTAGDFPFESAEAVAETIVSRAGL